jgi:signal transduction histidine kinase
MLHKNNEADIFSALRKEAEKLTIGNVSNHNDVYSDNEINALLHEVQVQQIELEMQNEQLQLTNQELETERIKFAGLFDLAPIGYFILDYSGIIKEVNTRGCKMLDLPKGDIIKKNFKDFIIRDGRETFIDFLEAIQIHEAKQSCQLSMRRPQDKFYAQIEGIVPAFDDPESLRCYIAVIDITEQKNAKANQEKQILAATLTAQENERDRISEALHDSVGQLLYGIKLKMAQYRIEDQQYKDVHQLLDQAINETRNISFELAPSILKDFGLPVTLDEMAKRLCTKQLSIEVETDLNDRLELTTEVTIFRVIQELVNNSIKHAAASKITISVKKDDKIIIELTDNGIGFDDKKYQPATAGSGLAAIRNRLSLYNGKMHIESSPGKGSYIYIYI